MIFFLKGPIGPRGPMGPVGKSGEDVGLNLCYYDNITSRTENIWRMEDKSCFVAPQGNNGRPGKPGDRGVPGPQVRGFLLNMDGEDRQTTVMETVSKQLFSFFFSNAGCSRIPWNPWTSRNEGTQSERWPFPYLSPDLIPCFCLFLHLITNSSLYPGLLWSGWSQRRVRCCWPQGENLPQPWNKFQVCASDVLPQTLLSLLLINLKNSLLPHVPPLGRDWCPWSCWKSWTGCETHNHFITFSLIYL